jgi:pimeloyl-ACP methyl ester carboxylesterase
MRRAERLLAWSWVAVALLGGCERWRNRGADAGAADAGPVGPSPVQLETDDGWRLAGTLHPGAPGATGAVLLLHQLGSSRAEWQPLVGLLQRPPAVTVLALDLRGHGESVQGPQNARQTWEGFGEDPARWAGLANDAAAGARYLYAAGAAQSVVAVGSSIGGSAAVVGLAEMPRAVAGADAAVALAAERQIVGLALVSPGLAYHGLETPDAMRRYAGLATTPARTVGMTAGDRDGESASALATLAAQASPLRVERAGGAASDAHGVSLLNADPARWASLDRYIRTVLGMPLRAATPAPAAAPAGR